MKDIMLKITGKQMSGDSEEDKLEFITEGKYYEKGESIYLLYDESEFSGMEGCTTSLKITGDIIKMKRFGTNIKLDTEIEFEKGKRFKGYYDTPYGSVEMEVLTNSIENNIEKSKAAGSLNIDYHISLRGLSEGRSKLDIVII
ncbi:DUF1934 domain-containing protein [Anaerovorax odorimutans]|uniref:DUF1934 domain-containing protein n=1 Tax=Anaerovorax odorimutans TaxID=109327 RepID=UPI0004828DC1|nr:DUF1934 domain-containing protein [Anaerovorax odorimutans]